MKKDMEANMQPKTTRFNGVVKSLNFAEKQNLKCHTFLQRDNKKYSISELSILPTFYEQLFCK